MASKKPKLGPTQRIVLGPQGLNGASRHRTQLILGRDQCAYLWLTDRGKHRTIKF